MAVPSDINLALNGSILLFILIVLTLIGLGLFVYRRTNPPVSRGLRHFLSALRILALVIILFLLFEPILSLTWTRMQRPVIGVLVDTSASMGLTDAKGARAEKTQQILKAPLFKELADSYELEFFQFSDKIEDWQVTEVESLRFQDDGTDLKAALEGLKEKMADRFLVGVILVSDGADNLGENPARYAEHYGLPIFPIAVGDPSEQKDVIISKVATNQITYANNRVPVDVTVKSSGFSDVKIPVSITQNDVILDTKNIELTGGSRESKIHLYYKPEEEGIFKYRVEVPRLEGELTYLNNRKSFYVKVLKSKMKVLIIAGSPSPDFSFIKRAFKGDKDLEITCLVEKKGGAFYQSQIPRTRESLRQYDCLVFLDYPRRDSQPRLLAALKASIEQDEKPLLFIAGNNVDYTRLGAFGNHLPFDPRLRRTSEKLVYLDLTPLGMAHPLVRLSDDEVENRNKWRDLPPLYYNFFNARLNEGSQALAVVDKQRSGIPSLRRDQPVIAIRKVATQKSTAILGYGLWRWDLLMWGAGKSNQEFLRFMGNCIRWLVTKEDTKLVRISADKEIYRSGEQVSFSAETYYEDYRPLDGAEVKLTIRGKSQKHQILLSGTGDGKYEGAVQILEGGDYTYEGIAEFKGRTLGTDQGKFSVEEFSMEFLNTRMNESLLKQMAHKSGGKYFTTNSFRAIKDSLRFSSKQETEHREWEIWNKTFLLIMAISLLCVEWFIRKRKGML